MSTTLHIALAATSLSLLSVCADVRAQDPDQAEEARREAALGRKASVDFDDTPAADAVEFLRQVTGLPIVLDPSGREHRVSLRVREVSVRSVLDLLCTTAGLERSDYAGVIYLHEPGADLLTAPRLDPDDPTVERLLARRVSLQADQLPLPDVLDALRQSTGVPLVLSRAALDVISHLPALSLHLRDAGAPQVLTLVGQQAGLTWRVYAGAVLLMLPGERQPRPPLLRGDTLLERTLRHRHVDLSCDETPLGDALDQLAETTGVNFVLSPEARQATDELRIPLTLELEAVPFREALSLLLLQAGCRWRLQHGVIGIDPHD